MPGFEPRPLDPKPGALLHPWAPCQGQTRGHRPLGSHVQETGGAELESSVRNLLKKIPRVPWTAWRSNQSILKEISPEYSLEGLTLKLKLQSFGHLMRRTDSLEKTLMLGKIEGRRRRGRQRMRRLDGITDSMDIESE